MVLSYGALQIQNGELHKQINSKDKTIDVLKIKLKKQQLKKEEKKYYEEQVNLQEKINLQIVQLSTSLLKLRQRDKPVVPAAFWGHRTFKKINLPSQTNVLCAEVSAPTTVSHKKSDSPFITRMTKAATRLQFKYGGVPSPPSRDVSEVEEKVVPVQVGRKVPKTTCSNHTVERKEPEHAQDRQVTNCKDTQECNTISEQVCPSVSKQELRDVPEVVEKAVLVCNDVPRQECRAETKQDPWLHSNENQDPWPPCNCGKVVRTTSFSYDSFHNFDSG